jgi:hypothetical protein
MLRRKSLVSAVFVPLLIGLIGLMNLMHQPRFASFRNVDVLQLIASGMCFGLALFALLLLMRGPRTSEPGRD